MRAYPIKFGTKSAMLLTDNVFDAVAADALVNFDVDIMLYVYLSYNTKSVISFTEVYMYN